MRRMTKSAVYMALCGAVVSVCSCGGKNGSGDFPDNFGTIGDAGRVSYMMKNVTPDSVARFICDAALGKVEGARIDSLPTATLYAYEHYKNTDLASFAAQYDAYSQSLPLEEKMKLYALAGSYDPQQLGYQLGLEYVGNIRSKKMTADQVAAELEEFKKACGNDHGTYKRFVKGFKVVLELEKGNGISGDIYSRFKNLNED
ncbi:hypothetical protein [uncultured Duncaniella sp.]|jgi:hypothetical protein|uniref:hypothetical protein n=1 Tax=uncultured Duncaniella sp. TaxID=2768039 RepID=UPI0025B1DB64|nr:hypothetical protein [uncultured Duncaniella sp.]